MTNDTVKMPAPSAPLDVARRLIDGHLVDGAHTLRWWRGQWIGWHGSAWADKEDAAIRKDLYTELEHAEYLRGLTKDGDEVWAPWAPSRRKIGDVLDALTAILYLPESVDPPTWLSGPRPAPAGRIVACKNGLLDVATRTLHSHTPRYFGLVSVPFEWRPDVEEPTRWLKFLRQLWPQIPDEDGALSEADEVLALQEWFGYVVSGRTDLQKILALIGPTRSGKGTIGRVLAELVGRGNTAGPTLASLATNFGLAPLLGKTLAIVSDARLASSNANTVVERLLSISGEDMLTVDRKFREPWTGKLSTRVTLLSNLLPQLSDGAGAIANRFIVLTMTESFLGRENTKLTAELLNELPGILGWALDGLDRLTQNRGFTVPASSTDAVVQLQDLASPVAAFVRDRCRRGTALTIAADDLWSAWKRWCEDNGHRAGRTQEFGRDLRAVVPNLRSSRPRNDSGKQVLTYHGLMLAPQWVEQRLSASQTATNGAGNGLSSTEQHLTPLQLQHANCSLCKLVVRGPFDDAGRCRECIPADQKESA